MIEFDNAPEIIKQEERDELRKNILEDDSLSEHNKNYFLSLFGL